MGMELDNRMVSAEWLKDKFYEICDQCKCSVIFIDRIIDEIDNAPDVEVVRCKDCKDYDNSEGICWCKLNSKFYPGGFDWHSFPEDGFCSYGERKDNE